MNRKLLNQKFMELMENTILPENSNKESIQYAWKNIGDLVLPNVPKQLFRFRSANLYSLMSLEHNTIALCNPDVFTDKYDSLIFVDKERIRNEVAKGFTTEYQKDLISEIRRTGAIPELFLQLFGVPNSNLIVQNIMNSSDIQIQDAMNTNQKENLIPLLDYVESIANNQIRNIRKNTLTKIACFTESVHSKIMWDRYADGYKGFALEYDLTGFLGEKESISPDELVHPSLFPVIYSNKRYDATNIVSWYLGDWFAKYMNMPESFIFPDILYWFKAFLYKDEAEYSYENEWRFMCQCKAEINKPFMKITCGNRLKGIYYGPEMAPDIKSHLHIVAQNLKIQEYDVLLNTEEPGFDLIVNPLG